MQSEILLTSGTIRTTSEVRMYTRYLCHASLCNSVVALLRNISVPENYSFDTIICNYLYRLPFPIPHIYGC